MRLRRTWISSYLHCIVERLSEIGGNAPGALHWGGTGEQMQPFKRCPHCSESSRLRWLKRLLTNSQEQSFQVSRCFPVDALLHLVSSHLHVRVEHWNKTRVMWLAPCATAPLWSSCTHLSSDALRCGFPGWWRRPAHRCRTSPLRPWRGPASTDTQHVCHW